MLLRYDYILTSSLSDKTDLISNFRIADLPGITDTKTWHFCNDLESQDSQTQKGERGKISVLFQHSAKNVHCRGNGGNSVTAVAEKEGFMYYISELVAPSL